MTWQYWCEKEKKYYYYEKNDINLVCQCGAILYMWKPEEKLKKNEWD